jgi:hypothetical protein
MKRSCHRHTNQDADGTQVKGRAQADQAVGRMEQEQDRQEQRRDQEIDRQPHGAAGDELPQILQIADRLARHPGVVAQGGRDGGREDGGAEPDGHRQKEL